MAPASARCWRAWRTRRRAPGVPAPWALLATGRTMVSYANWSPCKALQILVHPSCHVMQGRAGPARGSRARTRAAAPRTARATRTRGRRRPRWPAPSSPRRARSPRGMRTRTRSRTWRPGGSRSARCCCRRPRTSPAAQRTPITRGPVWVPTRGRGVSPGRAAGGRHRAGASPPLLAHSHHDSSDHDRGMRLGFRPATAECRTRAQEGAAPGERSGARAQAGAPWCPPGGPGAGGHEGAAPSEKQRLGTARLGALQAAQALDHGQRVRHDLARVVVVGEAVDDGHRRELRQLQDVLVPEQARHDDVVVPARGRGGAGRHRYEVRT